MLTVLITYYNYGAYLEACLQSVYAAACADFRLEVLLVDDCSASEHRAVLDGLRKRYPELKVLWNACNLGLARSRNAGLQAASGDYVFILDADNTIEVDCLHRHFQAMQADPALVACYAPVQSFDSAGRRLDYLRSNAPFSLGELRQGNYIDAMACFRRRTLLEIGLYDERLSHWGWEDYDLWLRIGTLGLSVHFIEGGPLSYYREHPANMTQLTTNRLADSLRLYLLQKYQLFSPLTVNWPALYKESRLVSLAAQLFFSAERLQRRGGPGTRLQ